MAYKNPAKIMAQTFIQSENFRCFIGQQSCLSGADVKDEILRN